MESDGAYHVWTDETFDRRYGMSAAVAAIREAIRSHASGDLLAPPRFSLDVDAGSLVFTAGAETREQSAMGFRVYETVPESPDDYQLVAVWDANTGHFLGTIIGNRVGAVRTGAIGGVAIDLLARKDASSLGIIGSGQQARTQLAAAVEVRDFEHIAVYSPTRANRRAFAAEMREKLGVAVEPVTSPRHAVSGADVLVTATTSREPVIDLDWLEPGVHVNAVGPKFRDLHEIDPAIADLVDLGATDSLAQLDRYEERDVGFFLEGSPIREDIVELSELIDGAARGRQSTDERTLFCSAGLAGTEVVIAHDALSRAKGA